MRFYRSKIKYYVKMSKIQFTTIWRKKRKLLDLIGARTAHLWVWRMSCGKRTSSRARTRDPGALTRWFNPSLPDASTGASYSAFTCWSNKSLPDDIISPSDDVTKIRVGSNLELGRVGLTRVDRVRLNRVDYVELAWSGPLGSAEWSNSSRLNWPVRVDRFWPVRLGKPVCSVHLFGSRAWVRS